MKITNKIFAATLLLASFNNVLADGTWQFGFEVGSPWIECSSGYTGSTADALGCSAGSPASSIPRFNVLPNRLQKNNESLELAASTVKTSFETPSYDGNGLDSNAFWTFGNGETFGYGQMMVSAMLQRSRNNGFPDLVLDIDPDELINEKAITAVMVPLLETDKEPQVLAGIPLTTPE